MLDLKLKNSGTTLLDFDSLYDIPDPDLKNTRTTEFEFGLIILNTGIGLIN